MRVNSNEFKIKQRCNREVLHLQRGFHWIQCSLSLDIHSCLSHIQQVVSRDSSYVQALGFGVHLGQV